jgi:acetyl-CoA carboxylase carboxyltransferase component
MFLTGPKVVKSVTGEDVTQDQLGGAQVHATKSSVAHFTSETEEEGIMKIRKLFSYLPSNNMEEAPMVECNDSIHRMEDRLNTIIPDNANKPYDVKDIIHDIVDNREFFEVHEAYAPNIVVGFARFNGRVVGL